MVFDFFSEPIGLGLSGKNTDVVLQNCTFLPLLGGHHVYLKDAIQLRMANCVFSPKESSIYVNDTVHMKVWNISFQYSGWTVLNSKNENFLDKAITDEIIVSEGKDSLVNTETPYASGEWAVLRFYLFHIKIFTARESLGNILANYSFPLIH